MVNTGRALADGRPETQWVFELYAVDGYTPPRASDEAKALITAALYAYGYAHTGPIGPLEIEYHAE